MSLDIQKLEKVRKLEGGTVQARCPACAEGGQDRKGEHLRVFADGRFGCCVHPKDGDHRKRIFALAGVLERQQIRVRVAGPKAAEILQPDVLGRLGRVFSSAAEVAPPLPALAAGILQSDFLGRLGRVFGSAAEVVQPPAVTLGTLGTPQYPYIVLEKEKDVHIYKDSQTGVPSVPSGGEHPISLDLETGVPSVPRVLERQVGEQSEIPVPSVPSEGAVLPTLGAGERLPYLTAGGDLVIPFDSPERYHWWKPDGERQSVAETLREVRGRMSDVSPEVKYAVTV